LHWRDHYQGKHYLALKMFDGEATESSFEVSGESKEKKIREKELFAGLSKDWCRGKNSKGKA